MAAATAFRHKHPRIDQRKLDEARVDSALRRLGGKGKLKKVFARRATATVTSNGRITLPRSIRQALKVGVGDRVDFVLEADGRVVVQATVRDVGELEGLLRKAGRKPVSTEQMNAAIARQGRSKQ